MQLRDSEIKDSESPGPKVRGYKYSVKPPPLTKVVSTWGKNGREEGGKLPGQIPSAHYLGYSKENDNIVLEHEY